jgi:cell division protein FtsL
MLFSRTYKYQSNMEIGDIKSKLLGKHVTVHNLDFEVFEKDRMLKIIPHDEQNDSFKTLPITHIEFNGKGNATQVIVSSKMRKIDKGGPLIVMTFCVFMLVAAILFMVLGKSDYEYFTYVLLGLSLGMFALLWIRLESGYFDYIRKLRDYIKLQSIA